jgi:hypothetical protein
MCQLAPPQAAQQLAGYRPLFLYQDWDLRPLQGHCCCFLLLLMVKQPQLLQLLWRQAAGPFLPLLLRAVLHVGCCQVQAVRLLQLLQG